MSRGAARAARVWSPPEPTMPHPPTCELCAVGKAYGEGAARVDALVDISLAIDPASFVAFAGPSGSGKTTLLNLVGCLDRPTAGEVLIEGQATGELGHRALSRLRARRIGFIFQSFNLIPVLTAVENVELALQLAGDDTDRRARAAAALERVGIGDLLHRRPSQLSGGQQQRVAIARALVKEPAIVLADEPTANLDSATGARVLELMQELNAERGTTFLFSTHDPVVIERARRVIRLRDGRVTSDEVR